MDGLNDLLNSEVLNEEVQTKLMEAWNKKLEEARLEIREEEGMKLREEFSARYAEDKAQLVEAMNQFITESVREELTEFAQDKKDVFNQKVRLTKAIQESRKEYKGKISAHMALLEKFFKEVMAEEIRELRGDHKKLREERIEVAKKLREARKNDSIVLAKRIKMLEGFVVSQLRGEVVELEQDRKALVETRVKLLKEGRVKIEEARKQFIQKAAKAADQQLTEAIRSEMKQFKDDIKVARENHFGRKMFEAFAAEYMTSYLSEGSEVKKLNKKLDEQRKKTSDAVDLLKKQQNLLESAKRKATILEEQATRTKVLNKLLSPLQGEKKAMMQELLATTKTGALNEQFKRFLPAVLKETATAKKPTLVESAKPVARRGVAATGNRHNMLAESVQQENNDTQAAIYDLQRLAGLKVA
jgi:hypothetical protein